MKLARSTVYWLNHYICEGSVGCCASSDNRCFWHQAHFKGARHISTRANVHLCSWFWLVMGPPKLAHSKWNISYENPTHRPKHKCCCELCNHFCAIPNIFNHAMPLQIWYFPVLCRMDRGYDHFCCIFLAGDKRGPFGFNVCSVGAPLVLATVCPEEILDKNTTGLW